MYNNEHNTLCIIIVIITYINIPSRNMTTRYITS